MHTPGPRLDDRTTVLSLTADELAASLPEQRRDGDVLRDPARLSSIAALDPFGDDVQELVADLLVRAAASAGTSAALLTIVLEDAQLVVSQLGIDGLWLSEAAALPVEWSLCAIAVADRATLVLPSTVDDPRSRDNPVVTVDGLAAYAGAPLLASDGAAVGALCVLGLEPLALDAGHAAVLEELAREAVRRLELRAAAGRP